jgi:uncharacterized damage-inducible protein DinB
METTVTTPAQPQSARAQFLDTFEREHQTTLKVLRAYPKDKADLKPHEMCKSAVGLASVFAAEMAMAAVALTTGFDWSRPMSMPKGPDTIDGAIEAFDQAHRQVVDLLGKATDQQLATEAVQFPTGPGQIGSWPKIQFLWFMLMDQIHHRGQFSIYLRMAGGKVPSIYGPSADEPWM